MIPRIALPLFLTILLGTNVALGHRYHQSSLHLKLLQVDNQIQAILEIDTDDFQSVLERDPNIEDSFVLEDLKNDKTAILAAEGFLGTQLEFQSDGAELRIRWHSISIGRKITKVYFLVVPKPGTTITTLSGLQVRNTLLFDWNSNQLNYIYVNGTKRFYRTSRVHDVRTVTLD